MRDQLPAPAAPQHSDAASSDDDHAPTLGLAQRLDTDSVARKQGARTGDPHTYRVALRRGEAVYLRMGQVADYGYTVEIGGQIDQTLFSNGAPGSFTSRVHCIFSAGQSGTYAFTFTSASDPDAYTEAFDQHFFIAQALPAGEGGTQAEAQIDPRGIRYQPLSAAQQDQAEALAHAHFTSNPSEGFPALVYGIVDKMGKATALFSADAKQVFDDAMDFANAEIFGMLDLALLAQTNSYMLGGLLIDFCPGLGDVVGVMEALQGVLSAWQGMLADPSAAALAIMTLAGIGLVAALIAVIPVIGDVIGKALRRFLDGAIELVRREMRKAGQVAGELLGVSPRLALPDGTIVPASEFAYDPHAPTGLRRMEADGPGGGRLGDSKLAGRAPHLNQRLVSDLDEAYGKNTLLTFAKPRIEAVLTNLDGVYGELDFIDQKAIDEMMSRLVSFDQGQQLGALAELEHAAQLLKRSDGTVGTVHFSVKSFDEIPEIDALYQYDGGAVTPPKMRQAASGSYIQNALVAREVKATPRGIEHFIHGQLDGLVHWQRNAPTGTTRLGELAIVDPTDWADGVLWRFETDRGQRTGAQILGDNGITLVLGTTTLSPRNLIDLSHSSYRKWLQVADQFGGDEVLYRAHLNQLGYAGSLTYFRTP